MRFQASAFCARELISFAFFESKLPKTKSWGMHQPTCTLWNNCINAIKLRQKSALELIFSRNHPKGKKIRRRLPLAWLQTLLFLRPAHKCYTVFVFIKSCISATYVVSRPEFDGTGLLIKVFQAVWYSEYDWHNCALNAWLLQASNLFAFYCF